MSRCRGSPPEVPVVKDRGNQKVDDQKSICDVTTGTISLATTCPEAIDGSRGESELLSSSTSQTFLVTAVVSEDPGVSPAKVIALETDPHPSTGVPVVELDIKRSY